MFTLAISFMVFSCSSFSIITDLTKKLTYSLIGADMFVDTGDYEYLDTDTISSFLDSMMDPDKGSPVTDYAYVTSILDNIIRAVNNYEGVGTSIAEL